MTLDQPDIAGSGISGMEPGFADYTLNAQNTFRTALDAMSRPGKIVTLDVLETAPPPLDVATAAIALCLLDHDTEVWLGDGVAGMQVYEYLRFHCGCPLTKASGNADFAIMVAEHGVPGLGQFDPGSNAFPDRSTTLIVQVPDMDNGPPIRLTGPGVETSETLHVAGVPPYFWQDRVEQQELFPCGADLIFTCGSRLVALPRSTAIEV